MVLSGVKGSTTSPPAVVIVRRGRINRTFERLQTGDVVPFAGGQREFVASVAGDLTGDTVLEFAVAAHRQRAAFVVAQVSAQVVEPDGALTGDQFAHASLPQAARHAYEA